MDKMKLAHDWAMKYGSPESFKLTVDKAWKYADEMQAEADKRSIETVADVGNTDVSDWQPDWSQAPEWVEWWAVDDNGEGWFYETQPSMGLCSWFIGDYGKAVFHNDSYKGDWQDSLRKRPDSK